MKSNAEKYMIPVCTSARMRRMNEVALLRHLHLHGESSRIELAAALGLDAKTVTNLVRDLLAKGCLRSAGLINIQRGRPRQMLQFNSRALQTIGMHLTGIEVRGARMDFEGRILDRCAIPLNRRVQGPELRRILRAVAGELLARSEGNVMGLGLAFPGMIDCRTQTILECVHLPAWKGMRVSDLFQGVYSGPFFYDRFTIAKALAEQWFGVARGHDNFILVDADAGIGCAIVHRGEILAGSTKLAGELGHMIVNPAGAQCGCGRRGCLETVCSLDIIRRLTRGRIPSRAADAGGATGAGNQAVQQAISEGGRALGLAVANLSQILNPSYVVLTGGLTAAGEPFLNAVRRGLKDSCSPAIARAIQIVAGATGENDALLGSGVLVLQSLFAV